MALLLQWKKQLGGSPSASPRDSAVVAGEGKRIWMSKRAERTLEQLLMAPSPAARRGMARRVHHLPRPMQLQLLDALLEKGDWELALMVRPRVLEDHSVFGGMHSALGSAPA